MLKKSTLSLLLASTLISLNSSADVTIQFESSAKNQPNAIYVKNGQVLIESRHGKGTGLYNSKSQTFSVLQHDQKKYIRMNEQRMERQMGMMENMRRQMMARMSSMPPEQRQMIEARMAKMGLPSMESINKQSRKAENRIQKTGKTHTINGFQCETVEIYRDEKQVSEACIANAKGLKISQTDFDTLMSLFSFSQKMASKAGKIGAAISSSFNASGGIPVYSKNLQDNSEQTISTVSSDTLKNSKFQIPSDYKEMKMPGME